MAEYISEDPAIVELAAISALVDDSKFDEAADAYERWVFRWDDQRIVDTGGTAHLKFHKRRFRRRSQGGRR